jgi:hypothetical protein
MGHHAVIAGTGRCGTTFLVELLTRLKLDTGYSEEQLDKQRSRKDGPSGERVNRIINPLDKDFTYTAWDPISRAGLEYDVLRDNAPYIVKSPSFCDIASKVLARDDIKIDHVFVPMRDLSAAAESRRQVVRANEKRLTLFEKLRDRSKFHARANRYAGGLLKSSSMQSGDQEHILCLQLYKLMLSLSSSEIPITLLRYPKLASNPEYLYQKLHPVLQGVSAEHFHSVFAKTARPELIHSYNQNDI